MAVGESRGLELRCRTPRNEVLSFDKCSDLWMRLCSGMTLGAGEVLILGKPHGSMMLYLLAASVTMWRARPIAPPANHSTGGAL